jgi:hypothetical protein
LALTQILKLAGAAILIALAAATIKGNSRFMALSISLTIELEGPAVVDSVPQSGGL